MISFQIWGNFANPQLMCSKDLLYILSHLWWVNNFPNASFQFLYVCLCLQTLHLFLLKPQKIGKVTPSVVTHCHYHNKTLNDIYTLFIRFFFLIGRVTASVLSSKTLPPSWYGSNSRSIAVCWKSYPDLGVTLRIYLFLKKKVVPGLGPWNLGIIF